MTTAKNTKTTVKKATETNAVSATESQKDQEIEQLKKELAKMASLEDDLKKLKEMMMSMQDSKEEVEQYTEEKEILPHHRINVISLVNNALNLSTRPKGGGKLIKFRKFGERKSIPYSDLVEICENHITFLEKGMFYIDSPLAIERMGYSEIFEDILDLEKIKIILSNSDNALDFYKSATDRQKETINSIFIQRIADHEEVDMNFVYAISKISGVDILEKSEDAKDYVEE